MVRGLPADFDPEEHERRPVNRVRLNEVVEGEGPNVLAVIVSKTVAREIRCWRCYRQPDGTWDCFRIDCPTSWPPGGGPGDQVAAPL